MSADPAAAVARAVLYEGYVLWPYRRSALKNQQRWTFGGVYPPAQAAAHPDDPAEMQTQVLVEGADPRVDVRVRFLQVVDRGVRNGAGAWVDELEVAGERHLAWQEATEREIVAAVPGRTPIDLPGGEAVEELGEGAALVRRWRPLEGTVAVRCERLADELRRLTVRIENASAWPGGTRAEALERTFVSTHTVLRARDGAFVSLTEPPPEHAEAVAVLENVRTWPVPVGEVGERHTLLSSPILLTDYPEIAPESPGDLFDGGEIDQLLILNVLALTEEEQAEARATDPLAREIIDRCASLSPEELMRLGGRLGVGGS